jgi:hypothetical protein
VKEAFMIVACILFLIDVFLWWVPPRTYGGRATPLGLFFFAASFLSFVH